MDPVRVVQAGAALAVVLLLAACGAEPGPGGPQTPDGTPTSHELPTTPGGTTPPAQDPSSSPDERAPGVEAAVADLAEHLGVDPGEVGVVSLEDVTWPDGSLGCPQPGMSYTMAQVPGSRLVLAVDGREYAYHAGREPEFFRCTTPRVSRDG